jgi:single-strand DNA-binding protein
MIKLTAIGHLGKDANSNNVSGKTVINFAVAHSEKYKDAQGNLQTKTIWVDCAYWTDKVAILPYLKKGTQVYIEGKPEATTYHKGSDIFPKLNVRISSVQLLGSSTASDTPQQAAATPTAQPTTQAAADPDDLGLPF